MIYRFKLVSNEKSNFSRTIEIDSESNFLQLRNAILQSVGYSTEEMDSFFICDDDWERLQEITLEDMGSMSDQDIYLMAETPLYDLVEEEGQKVSFVFDYMTERSFFMELQKIIPGKNLSAPVCTIKMGVPPNQKVDLAEFEEANDRKAASLEDDLDADFYGDQSFNEEELDGLDEIDMED